MDTLGRFVDAQSGGVWDRALAELEAGHKRSHWMWFVFPQLQGLGRSPTAVAFAIRDLVEARSYLADPVLGSRLKTGCDALLGHRDLSADAILGSVDAMKLRSSMTLFAMAGAGFCADVLERFFAGERCRLTCNLLMER